MRSVYRKYEKEIILTHIDYDDVIHTYKAKGPYMGEKNSAKLARELMVALEKEEGISSSTLEERIKRCIKRGKNYQYSDEKQLHYTIKLNNGFELENIMYLVEEKETIIPSAPKYVLRPMDEFNGYTPQDSLDYIVSQIGDVFEADDERLSDAIKRLQVLINEAK